MAKIRDEGINSNFFYALRFSWVGSRTDILIVVGFMSRPVDVLTERQCV